MRLPTGKAGHDGVTLKRLFAQKNDDAFAFGDAVD